MNTSPRSSRSKRPIDIPPTLWTWSEANCAALDKAVEKVLGDDVKTQFAGVWDRDMHDVFEHLITDLLEQLEKHTLVRQRLFLSVWVTALVKR